MTPRRLEFLQEFKSSVVLNGELGMSIYNVYHQESPKANNKNQEEVNSLSNIKQYPAGEAVLTYAAVDRLTTAITALTRTPENQPSTNLHGSTQTTTPMNIQNNTKGSLNPDIENLHTKKEYNPKASTQSIFEMDKGSKTENYIGQRGASSCSLPRRTHGPKIQLWMPVTFRPSEDMILTTDEVACVAYIFGQDLKDEMLVSTKISYAKREGLTTLVPGEQVTQEQFALSWSRPPNKVREQFAQHFMHKVDYLSRAIFIERMLQHKSFYNSTNILIPQVSKFDIVEPSDLPQQRRGSQHLYQEAVYLSSSKRKMEQSVHPNNQNPTMDTPKLDSLKHFSQKSGNPTTSATIPGEEFAIMFGNTLNSAWKLWMEALALWGVCWVCPGSGKACFEAWVGAKRNAIIFKKSSWDRKCDLQEAVRVSLLWEKEWMQRRMGFD
ncbi:hypothetical protein PIB30_062708 [Stylosanthes scabra]|uniref:Uncharacterized protein n=1 Tax=Stylosanthes scabra TaxID=79078 RepID=A0ABU6SL75_9FABA|nr:hypothetical protein [Stylosanthes scabra]